MTESYPNPSAEQDGAQIISFPQRGEADDDGLGVPDWVNADQPADNGPSLSESATNSHIIEGVIVSPTAGPSRAQRRARRRRQLSAARAALTHPAVRGSGRQLVYLALGLKVVGRRYWQSRTTSLHERMMRTAVTMGDHDSALEWEERAAIRRFERHERRMELLSAPVDAARAVFAGTVGGAFLLLVAGIALWVHSGHIADVVTPFTVTAAVVKTIADIVRVTWRPLIALALLASVLGLWQAGRNEREALPMWLAPAGELPAAPDASWITPSIVVLALRDLGHTVLRKKIEEMADGAGAMLGPIKTAGVGVEVDVMLPRGVDTGEILARHTKLAENLGRHKHELYLEVPGDLRNTVRLWIADIGALDEKVGPSPLVTDPDMVANWFTGSAPWGVDLRRNPIGLRLYQRHALLTGLSNHGKTASLRAAILWAVLDPCVEVWLADLKGVGDWGMFEGLASILIQGPTDAHVIATVEMVEDAADEMDRRLLAVGELNLPNGVDEKLARKPGSGFHPIIVVVDEAQVAVMCGAKDGNKKPYGGLTNESRFLTACRRIHNQGRAVNVTLQLGTQDPDPQNFPKMLRNGSHLRASLPLGSEGQAKMVLGEDAVKAGATPHRLRRGIDKGVVVATGEGVDFPVGQPHMTVWTHFIDGDDATAIADRAKTRRAAMTSRTGAHDAAEELPPLDVLADVAAILDGAPRMLTQEAMQRLAERDERYREWTNADFKAALDEAGAATYTYNGRMHVHGDRVREALSRRFSATD
ncbi:MAG: ATP-binding protein [Catenulispora sp.]